MGYNREPLIPIDLAIILKPIDIPETIDKITFCENNVTKFEEELVVQNFEIIHYKV